VRKCDRKLRIFAIFSQAIALSGAALLPDLLCYYRLHSKNLYASESFDEQRFRRRVELLESLSEYLSARLKTLGVSNDAISAFLESDRIAAKTSSGPRWGHATGNFPRRIIRLSDRISQSGFGIHVLQDAGAFRYANHAPENVLPLAAVVHGTGADAISSTNWERYADSSR
jgi:hypothetical protein